MAYAQGPGIGIADKTNYISTNYVNADGKLENGYIINNKTYKDKEGKQRVDIGSIVETNGGIFRLTANGGEKLNGELKDYIRTDEITIPNIEDDTREEEVITDNGKDESVTNTTKRDYFQNFDGLEIEIEFGDGKRVDILNDVFLRDETVKIDGSGRAISKAIKFIAKDLKEVD